MSFTDPFPPIHERIRSLHRRQLIAFGLLAFERALPAFHRFQAESGATGGAVLIGALAKSWSVLEGGAGPMAWPQPADCAAVTPDTEHFISNYTSAALDAATIAENLLIFLEASDASGIVEISTLRRDTIDLFVQKNLKRVMNQTELDQIIIDHPLMKREIANQIADLDFLANDPETRHIYGWILDRQYRDVDLRL